MSVVKCRYVAQVEIEAETERTENTNSLEYIKDCYVNGYVTNALKEIIYDEVSEENVKAKVTVTQQYADVYEVEDD